MSTRVRSFCKINLGLAVGPLRPDGFHALTTLYQTLALHDLVTVTARPARETSITLTADHPGVPRTERGDAEKNTAYRIVDLALRQLGLTAEVHLDIAKRLPVQGGLGAGSANAAAALIGLEKELSNCEPGRLSGPARLALAAQVGSDVPLFLLGGTVLGLCPRRRGLSPSGSAGYALCCGRPVGRRLHCRRVPRARRPSDRRPARRIVDPRPKYK